MVFRETSSPPPPPRLQCNTQLSLRSGVSPSGLRAQDSEIPNLSITVDHLVTKHLRFRASSRGGHWLFLKDYFFFYEECKSLFPVFHVSCCRSDSLLEQRRAQLWFTVGRDSMTTLLLIPPVFAVAPIESVNHALGLATRLASWSDYLTLLVNAKPLLYDIV